jgi:hypothetical protein
VAESASMITNARIRIASLDSAEASRWESLVNRMKIAMLSSHVKPSLHGRLPLLAKDLVFTETLALATLTAIQRHFAGISTAQISPPT